MSYSRREFLQTSALAMGSLAFRGISDDSEPLSLHVFSKHLQFLDFKDMASFARDAGFQGVDLTVRRGGHVPPEKVEALLPQAVTAIKTAGLKAEMMATNINDAADPLSLRVLKAASQVGIKYYRMAYYNFPSNKSIPDGMAQWHEQVGYLNQINKELNMVGCYQNHAGMHLGANIWEVWELLKGEENEFIGSQYDIRHAVVEGGQSWRNGFRLIQPIIKNIVLKDFKWGKVEGKWKPVNTPIGEGMVDFISYFKLLKQFNINVPVSIHFEYEMGGAERGRREINWSPKDVMRAMKKDIETVRSLWEEA